MTKDIILGALCFLIPSIIGASLWLVRIYIPKKIEAQVNHQYNLKLEEFKYNLTSAAAEKQVRFSHVYEKTAEVVITFYKNLTETHAAFIAIVDHTFGPKTIQQAWTDAEMKRHDLRLFIMHHNIYFPPQCETGVVEVQSVIDELSEITQRHVVRTGAGDAGLDKTTVSQLATNMQSFGAIHSPLKLEFQKLLGIVMDDNKKVVASI